VGERNVADVTAGGPSCEYAVAVTDRFGFRLACILVTFFVALMIMSPGVLLLVHYDVYATRCGEPLRWPESGESDGFGHFGKLQSQEVANH
jgi:hypothetical protein